MRLAVISACYPPMRAAEADYAHRFCHGMAERGFQVDVYTSAQGVVEESGAVTTIPLAVRWTWREMPGILTAIKKSGADAVAFLYLGWPYGDGHPMATFLPGMLRRVGFVGPIVTLFYNRYGAELDKASLTTRLIQRALEWGFRRHHVIFEYGTTVTHSDHIFVLNRAQQAWVAQIYPDRSSDIEVLPSLPLLKLSSLSLEAATRRARERFQVGADGQLIGFFGYVYRGKGLETLLRALTQTSSKVKLLILGGTLARSNPADFGDEYRAELQQLAHSLGISARVIWYGGYDWQSDEASELLFGLDAIVLPFDDGIALNNSSVAAAASHARPIISCGSSQTEPAFVHGHNVWLSPAGDAPALAQGIDRVLGDDELKYALARGSRKLADEYFSWERACGRWSEVLKSLASRAVR